MLAYLVRHAESLANVKQTDSLNGGLTDLGRRQTEAIAQRLATARPAAIYCSPFSRCIETAIPLAERLSMPIWIRPELCEHHHLPAGANRPHEVDTIDAIRQAYPQVAGCPDFGEAFDWVETDESFDDLLSRIFRFQSFLKDRWKGDESVVVFSHGSPIARLIDAWLTNEPGPSFRFIIDNAAVSALRLHEGVSSLVCMNDVSHLAGLPAPAAGNYTSERTLKAIPSSSYW